MMEVVLLMLLLVQQLRFIVAASDVMIVRNELRILENDINTFMFKVEHSKAALTIPSLNQIPAGVFLRPPKVNTTIVKNKIYELQNNVTKLTEDLTNSNQNVDGIKVRISALEKQLEDLKRLFDNENREVKQTLAKFQSSFSEMLGNYTRFLAQNQIREQQLAKVNLELRVDYLEFLEAIKHKYYPFAAVKFITLKNESEATELIRKVYRQLDNVDCLLNFADNLNNMNKTLLVYRTLSQILGGFDLIETCKLFKTRMKLYYDLENNKVSDELLDAANSILSNVDLLMETWLHFLTIWLRQDLIVKIKLHNGLYMPASYVYNINSGNIDLEQYRRSGRRTAVLSCYPIDCR
uniref:Secreted protein n=1 Tax=Rhodnius prolixus TaxID=13249 RepID=A0A4P6D6Z0_RHOPR